MTRRNLFVKFAALLGFLQLGKLFPSPVVIGLQIELARDKFPPLYNIPYHMDDVYLGPWLGIKRDP